MALNPMEVIYERRCAKYIYTVPAGLTELMSDISREVIRDNTKHEQLYTFIADYLDTLLVTRENCRVASRFVNDIVTTGKLMTSLMRDVDCSKRRADYAAKIIQQAFRSHLARRMFYETMPDYHENLIAETLPEKLHVSPEKLNIAASIIQRAFRDFSRRSLLNDCMVLDWRFKAQRTIGVYKQTRPTLAEMHRAATLIKAAYKGYYTRRKLQELREKARKEYFRDIDKYMTSDLSTESEYEGLINFDPETLRKAHDDYAALTIQRIFRGYLVRKQLAIKENEIITKTYVVNTNSEDDVNTRSDFKNSSTDFESVVDDVFRSECNLASRLDNSYQTSNDIDQTEPKVMIYV